MLGLQTGTTTFFITSLIVVRGQKQVLSEKSPVNGYIQTRPGGPFQEGPGPGFMHTTVSLMVGFSLYFLLELQNTLSSLEPSSSQSHAHSLGPENLFLQGPKVLWSDL